MPNGQACSTMDALKDLIKNATEHLLNASGMFWSEIGANAIIALRSCVYSRRFDQFWRDRANKTHQNVVHPIA
jgi:hypothetical protein